MDKPQSFSEYLAMSTADKMRLIRANEPLIRANESRTTTPPVADPQAEYWGSDGRCVHCGAGNDAHHSYTCPTNMHPDKRVDLVADPQADLAEAVALLRMCDNKARYCPLCDNALSNAVNLHAADCRLAAFLARHKEGAPPNPDPVCADCGRDLPADGYCECAKQEATPS